MEVRARILIVEDEWLIAEDHAASLREAGYVVVGPVPSVKQALQAMETRKSILPFSIFSFGRKRACRWRNI